MHERNTVRWCVTKPRERFHEPGQRAAGGAAAMAGQRNTLIRGPALGYWHLSPLGIKSLRIEVGPQYIVLINHPGPYMKTSEMELPKHVYTETTSPCGTMTRFIIAPDKLISWAEAGRGDAILRLCHQACERKLKAIDAWESSRIMQLEGKCIAAGNDEGAYSLEDQDLTEQSYHVVCETIAREAEMKRASVRERMSEHKSAVEKLVRDARAFIATHEPPPEEDDVAVYLLAIGAILTLGYFLFT